MNKSQFYAQNQLNKLVQSKSTRWKTSGSSNAIVGISNLGSVTLDTLNQEKYERIEFSVKQRNSSGETTFYWTSIEFPKLYSEVSGLYSYAIQIAKGVGEKIDSVMSSKAEELNLSGLGLISFPVGICNLTSLKHLQISNNRISSIPAGIVQLNDLQILDVSNNKIKELSEHILQLTSLKFLNLSYNQINQLPPEIGQLTNLQSLDFRNNKIDKLPSEIGQLTNLKSLYVYGNKLRKLTSGIAQLQHLKYFDVRHNKLDQLPPEIRKYIDDPNESAEKFPIYYRQFLEQENIRLYEAKLLIVGEGGVGKTSLAKKLEDEDYQLNSAESSTEGIEITQYPFSLKDGKEFRVNIWDFGGQEIYYATHQFFLTKSSLYILVVDTRKEDTDFFYWLNAIELLGGNSPLLIVKNEKQDRQREINERRLRSEFSNLKEVFATNLATNRGLSEIKRAIQYYITQLPHVGTELPKTWVKVRQALEANSRNHITLEEYLNLCQENGFTRYKDKLQLSGYLHDLGVCLHFQNDDLLRKTVILKPTWGTDAVYKVLDNPQVIQNLGKFDRRDLAAIWREDQYAAMRPELLRLMMNFKLCYEIPSRPNTYIAPQLLSPNQPEYTWNEVDNLLLRYIYDFMPKGILTRFIVEMHPWIEDQTHVWKTGVVLRSKDGARAEVIELYHCKEIRIRVSGSRRRDLLTAVRYELDKIHVSYDRLKYSTLVPCNCRTCKGRQDPHFYPFHKLQERITNGKQTIECDNAPYLNVNISSLIEDVTREPIAKSSAQLPIRDQVFISYSHQDQKWLTQLQTQLKPLIRNQAISVWDDTQIQVGTEWREEIDQALAAAKVAMLMVSPSFLASDFIANNELPPLLNAAESKGLTIIWIPISYSLYEETEIAKFQAALSPSQPIDSLDQAEQDKAWVAICKQIKAAFNS